MVWQWYRVGPKSVYPNFEVSILKVSRGLGSSQELQVMPFLEQKWKSGSRGWTRLEAWIGSANELWLPINFSKFFFFSIFIFCFISGTGFRILSFWIAKFALLRTWGVCLHTAGSQNLERVSISVLESVLGKFFLFHFLFLRFASTYRLHFFSSFPFVVLIK